MTHDLRRSGIPVLVYPASHASPVSSSLIFRFNEGRATASLLLQSLLFIHGYDAKHVFIMQYDADNLKPGKNSLGPATIPLPQWRLDQVSRQGNPQIRTLSLTLKKMCPVWTPSSLGPVRPKLDHEAAFTLLANLAKATKLHILFDYNWLHRDHHNIFQTLVDHPEQLIGFPVSRHYSKQYRREDWSVFNAENAGDDATTEDEAPVEEAPPMYTEGNKRPRHVTPTPSSPPPKRVLLSPYPDTHTSPTEKDSVATPSPKPLPSTATTPNPRFLPLPALPPDLPKSTASSLQCPPSYINLDTTSQKPAPFVASCPGHPLSQNKPDLRRVIEETASTIIPSMLETLIPSLLPRLLTASSPSPTPSLQSMASQTSTTPPPPVLSALGVSLGEHMTHRIEHELSSLYHHTVSHANHLRNAADAQFFDELEGKRLEFECVAEYRFGEFKDMIEECGEAEVERVGCKMDEFCDKAMEEVDKLQEEKADLKREREELKNDKAELRLEKEELRLEKECLRREKQELRVEKEHVRRQKRVLQRESYLLQSARPTDKLQGHIIQGTRAASLPA
ncbi:uncharacterized protein EKO05_0007141 [Ascochyta rabiei]|uniref:uncharacterized protein n=1 Tax=Didymella rabiei TaxID=5454 RepID=UPI002201FF35|nr:uncharacterized protein EKO05_0007141 [Ascochyta rabiei]UPX16755.1 hypothetical protein EKO05_0007141 [Ascochyta rabiei]